MQSALALGLRQGFILGKSQKEQAQRECILRSAEVEKGVMSQAQRGGKASLRQASAVRKIPHSLGQRQNMVCKRFNHKAQREARTANTGRKCGSCATALS